MSEDINNDRPTLTDYIESLTAPQWQLDGFDSESAYESNWCNQVREWHRQSEEASRSIRDIWTTCYKAMTQPTMRSASSSPTFEDNISSYRITLMKNECLEEVAALYANDYIPTLTALTDSAKQMAQLGNMYMQQEFKINGWAARKFTLGVDAFITRMWVVQVNTDDDMPGPFGQEKRITLNRVDPRNFFPDMKAGTMDWATMDYIIATEELDMGVARSRFKDKAADLTLALAEPDKPLTKRFSNSLLVTMPGMKGINESVTDRVRIQIKACWLHDERYKFVAEEYEDSEGRQQVRLDDDDRVIGSWEKAYPYGRLVVTAGDKLVVRDIANPFWHKEAPFVICQQEPDMGDTIGVGKAAELLGIERKINDVETRVHSYSQSEIERPMQADIGALVSNSAYYKTTGMSRAIMLKNQGRAFVRPPAVETPQFIPGYLQRLEGYAQKITGRTPLLMGALPDNVSGQAVQSAQGYGASRMGMQAILISEAMRKMGFQVFETMRQTYPENISATIPLPTGEEVKVDWDSSKLDGAYVVGIDLAANAPGGKQAMNNQLIQMYEGGLTDDIYTLQGLGIDNWPEIIKRKRAWKEQQIYDQAAGRAAGLEIKEYTKTDNKAGAPKQPRAGAA